MSSDLTGETASARRRRLRAFVGNRAAVAAAVFLVIVVLVALLADWLAPFDPNKTELRFTLQTPGSSCAADLCSAAGRRLLGTDDLGRDILSRLIVASRTSVLAGFASVLVALVVALPLGLLAGYYGGPFDRIVGWLVDLVLSIPPLVLVFAVAGILGPSFRNAILAIGLYFVPVFIRLIRSQTRELVHGPLVEAERALGAGTTRILGVHILPNIASPLIVQGSLSVGTGILAEASLSFLGLGVSPPTASWGNMMSEAFGIIITDPWLITFPSFAVAATVLAVNLLGDGLRDMFSRTDR